MTEIEKLRVENKILQARNLDIEIENAFIKNSRNWRAVGFYRC